MATPEQRATADSLLDEAREDLRTCVRKVEQAYTMLGLRRDRAHRPREGAPDVAIYHDAAGYIGKLRAFAQIDFYHEGSDDA